MYNVCRGPTGVRQIQITPIVYRKCKVFIDETRVRTGQQDIDVDIGELVLPDNITTLIEYRQCIDHGTQERPEYITHFDVLMLFGSTVSIGDFIPPRFCGVRDVCDGITILHGGDQRLCLTGLSGGSTLRCIELSKTGIMGTFPVFPTVTILTLTNNDSLTGISGGEHITHLDLNHNISIRGVFDVPVNTIRLSMGYCRKLTKIMYGPHIESITVCNCALGGEFYVRSSVTYLDISFNAGITSIAGGKNLKRLYARATGLTGTLCLHDKVIHVDICRTSITTVTGGRPNMMVNQTTTFSI